MAGWMNVSFFVCPSFLCGYRTTHLPLKVKANSGSVGGNEWAMWLFEAVLIFQERCTKIVFFSKQKIQSLCITETHETTRALTYYDLYESFTWVKLSFNFLLILKGFNLTLILKWNLIYFSIKYIYIDFSKTHFAAGKPPILDRDHMLVYEI